MISNCNPDRLKRILLILNLNTLPYSPKGWGQPEGHPQPREARFLWSGWTSVEVHLAGTAKEHLIRLSHGSVGHGGTEFVAHVKTFVSVHTSVT